MKTTFLLAATLFAVGCANNAAPVSQSNTPMSNAQSPGRSETAIAHSSEKQMPPAAGNSNAAAPASRPYAMGDAIDTTKLDAAIMAAEKSLGSKPNDDGAKKKLAGAFYERAVALTEARQYASALGDYRRTLKYDPANADAKQWVDQITMIYEGLRRPAPAEGQEPPPMPFKKS